MQFLAPTMMLGALAVTVPLALHFFYRARYKPLPWAPMKFLKEAVEQTSRRLKFQEWILLALRCLALILLALALARPGLKSESAGGGDQPIDAVFVFDTSYSMAAKDGDKTRLERAKDAATAILDTLPDRSSVQIITCADRAKPPDPKLSRFNRDQAKQRVQAIELTSLSTDLLPGLTEALAAAETGTAAAKEIYVFTDMQKTGFELQQSAVRSKCEEIKAKANLIFIRCGSAGAEDRQRERDRRATAGRDPAHPDAGAVQGDPQEHRPRPAPRGEGVARTRRQGGREGRGSG